MRLFAGISLPEATIYHLEAFLAPLRPLANIRWSPLQNLHVTTKFIGEWPEERLTELQRAVQEVAAEPFEMKLGGLGWFSNPHSPHVFWMGVDGGDALPELVLRTSTTLEKLGCAKEQRAYSPHLTLARTRREAKLQRLRQALEELEAPALPPFDVTDFHLYQSDGGVYRRLSSMSLSFPRRS